MRHDDEYKQAVSRAEIRYKDFDRDHLLIEQQKIREAYRYHGPKHDLVAALEVIYKRLEQ